MGAARSAGNVFGELISFPKRLLVIVNLFIRRTTGDPGPPDTPSTQKRLADGAKSIGISTKISSVGDDDDDDDNNDDEEDNDDDNDYIQ